MNKKFLFGVSAAVIVVAALYGLRAYKNTPPAGPVACPMLARVCPDGSSVGPTGPDCEFVCPDSSGASSNGIIQVVSPQPEAAISSPLVVSGQARGTWYFEASFPVKLFDGNGKQLAAVPAQAQGDWMTTEFVPFEATLLFTAPTTSTGMLVLEKDNPSGLLQNSASISIPVRFNASASSEGSGVAGTVVLGPVCPVEHIPPDPACAPKPYATTIQITRAGSTAVVASTRSDAQGSFRVKLAPGLYVIAAQGKVPLPRCSPVSIEVKQGQFGSVEISCDTGIR